MYLFTCRVPHTFIDPVAKSKMVAVGDCDDRVSPRNRAKHCSSWSAVRSTPPSKNSRGLRAPPSLSGWAHGGLTAALVLTMAQAAAGSPVAGSIGSGVPGAGQSPPVPTGVVPSDPLAPPFHRSAWTLATLPPLVNAETTSRSPSWWAPVKSLAPPVELHPTEPSFRNHMAMLESPLGDAFSMPKYRTRCPLAGSRKATL